MVLPYSVGIITAPLVAKIVKQLLRGAVKTTIGAGLQVKKLAAEASDELAGLISEVSTDMATNTAASAESAVGTPGKTVAGSADTIARTAAGTGSAASTTTRTAADTAAKAADDTGRHRGPRAPRSGTTPFT